MKRKDKEQFKTLSLSELRKTLQDMEEKLKIWSVERRVKQVKNVREVAELRRKIAVALTIIREKELYEQTNK